MLFSGVYELWPDPLVVSCLDGAEMMAAFRIPRQADILVHPAWMQTARTLPRLIRDSVRAGNFGKRAHFMCCSPESDRLLRTLRFPGALVSISAYLNESLYRVTDAPKQYDAVYAARMAPYKRLHLAAQVSSLFVQTYGSCRTADGVYDLHRYEPSVSHCDFNRTWLTQDELVTIYNRARVGLALSRREGAMLASVEYMLCGLPVVSTRCSGGRELFFDDAYVRIVDASAEAVAAGVREVIARRVDPQVVRTRTIQKLQRHRERLCDYVIQVIRSRGALPPPRDRLLDTIFGSDRGARGSFVPLRDFAARGFA
jgi:glycosyltransferase involved in cell wall biosynthesis